VYLPDPTLKPDEGDLDWIYFAQEMAPRRILLENKALGMEITEKAKNILRISRACLSKLSWPYCRSIGSESGKQS
jgi:hypothetical protein